MRELPKIYEPSEVEPRLAKSWLQAGCFKRSAEVDHRGDCTVVIPPPNVTGVLHMGHAMDDTIQDTFIRFMRMRGYSTRWIVGSDHAGIATQTKVDKKLKSEGISRLEIGREAFLDACWKWREEFGGIIIQQIKRMGCSCDFSDEKFTMSAEYAAAVRKVFCDWYHDGLIYRGKRIVNWCPECKTAISDDEAEYRDEDSHLWHLRYPLTEPVGDIDHIVVATTRPETMLGDTGIAVSPDDPSKAALIGKTVMLPIVNREIPIFADWHVDKDFGSGFVKVTPAHDPNDHAMGEAHNLEQINIFDESAHVVEGYGQFSGMSRDEARAAVVAWFEEHDLLECIDDHPHSVMHCYRCDATLEPWLSEQWFVSVDRLKEPAIEAVTSGKVKFHPERWEQGYLSWMRNLRDWCISRQLWWGHRIPVFYCDNCGWQDASKEDIQNCPNCGAHLRQDEDVLDTWFSSQLWSFATQGWPENPEELSAHHPTKVLVTARDIIALWVARMVMSSLYFCNEIPFEDVFIYATILAKDGSRMSKSKGNGVDPMELMDAYGADAMRFNLLSLVTGNQDVRFDAKREKDGSLSSPRTEQARSFVTKVWNASRFVLMNMEGYVHGDPSASTTEDAWILSRLARVCAETTEQLRRYDFGEYTRSIQGFVWNDLCDWYIELCKARLQSEDSELRLQAQRNLMFVLLHALQLLHPAMPFVTEEVFSALKPLLPSDWTQYRQPEDAEAEQKIDFLMMSSWPEPRELEQFIDDEAELSFDLARSIVVGLRSARARYGLSPRVELDLKLKAEPEVAKLIAEQEAFISSVGKLSSLEVRDMLERPEASVVFSHPRFDAYIVMGDLVDFDAERERLKKELAQAQKGFDSIDKVLNNQGFLAKASEEIVAQKKERHEHYRELIEKISAELNDLA